MQIAERSWSILSGGGKGLKAVYLEEGAVNRGDISLEPVTSLMETVVFTNTTEENKFEHIGDAEVVYTNKIIFDKETFDRLPNLKYLGVCATGYNVIDLEAAKRHGVRVTNVPAYSTESVAQLAWGLILECADRIGLHNESVRAGDWIRSENFCYWLSPVMELAGKTLGIIGYGNIGRRVAEIGLAFHMHVLVYTAHPEKREGNGAASLRFVSLDEVFREADVISLHCPLVPETAELIRKENLEKMKKGVVLINVSRGGLVNEADLAEALRSGRVAAAGADVVAAEPMAADNPLFGAPNICITPHMAWASVEARRRLIGTVADNCRAFLRGEEQNVIA